MEIIYILIGLVVGAVIAYLFSKSKSTAILAVHQTELAGKSSTIDSLNTTISKLENQLKEAAEKLTTLSAHGSQQIGRAHV